MSLAAIFPFALSKGISNTSSLVSAMMRDATDGTMDGKAGSTFIQMNKGGMMGPMASNAGTVGLGSATDTFMNSGANKSGLTAVDILTISQKIVGIERGQLTLQVRLLSLPHDWGSDCSGESVLQ